MEVEEVIAAVENAPALRFPEFEGEWVVGKLKDLIKSVDSGWSPQCEAGPSGIEEWGVLRTTAVMWEGFNELENKKLPDDLEERSEIEVVANDILITRAGPTTRVGVAVHVDKVRPRLMLSDKIIRLKTKDNYVSKFVSLLLANPHAQKQLVSKSSGLASSQTNISQSILLNINLIYPHKLEQLKISSFLSAVDDKIQQLTKKRELLEKYKQGVMHQIFSQQLRFKDENGQNFPEWELKKAKDVFKNHSNKKHDGDLPILAITQDMGTVLRDSIGIDIKSSEASVKSYKIIEKGDFIISLRSFQGGIEYSDITGICSPAYTVLKATTEIDSNFFKFYFKKDSFIQQLSATVVGIRDGKQISYDAFSGMKLLFPSVPEQTKISEFLTAIDAKISLVAKQLEQVRKFKKGLLQQMFV